MSFVEASAIDGDEKKGIIAAIMQIAI